MDLPRTMDSAAMSTSWQVAKRLLGPPCLWRSTSCSMSLGVSGSTASSTCSTGTHAGGQDRGQGGLGGGGGIDITLPSLESVLTT